jgi:hypothetical protein
MKKEAFLHGGAEDSGQPQDDEEEENIYAVVPDPEVRESCMCDVLHVEHWKMLR